MKPALIVLRSEPGTPLVAFVGHKQRTRYSDQDILAAVLQILREERLFRPVHGRKPAFDTYVQELSEDLGLSPLPFGPEDLNQRLGDYERPAEMLDNCCMLIEFPNAEGVSDPRIVALAEGRGLPIVTIDAEGDATFR